MNLIDIKNKINSNEYDFLRTNEHLGESIILLGLGGSYAYGTNIKTSDLDVRGCALNSKEEILTNCNFEQFINEATDTTIYSFNKLVKLLTGCNPNTIEILGLKKEHYLYLSPIGNELLNNKKLFLSQKCAFTFGSYASSQLRRLDNKAMRTVSQAEKEQHILNSVNNAMYDLKTRYFPLDENNSINLYIDKAINKDYNSEIFMDVNLTHYPLRDYKAMWSEMNAIVKSYSKVGRRNQKAIEHGKLAKHMMHLVRLYLMCLDILEKEEIITYRENDLDLLMSIRNGNYLDDNNQPIAEFFEMVDEFEKRMEYAKQNTSLPEKPNYKEINDFIISVNERIVKGEI